LLISSYSLLLLLICYAFSAFVNGALIILISDRVSVIGLIGQYRFKNLSPGGEDLMMLIGVFQALFFQFLLYICVDPARVNASQLGHKPF